MPPESAAIGIALSTPNSSIRTTVKVTSPSNAIVFGWRVPCAARSDTNFPTVKSRSAGGTVHATSDAADQLKTDARVASLVRARVAPLNGSVVAQVKTVLRSFCADSAVLATPESVTLPPELEVVVAPFV